MKVTTTLLERLRRRSGDPISLRHDATQLARVLVSKWSLRRVAELGALSRVTNGRVAVTGEGRIVIGERTRLMAHYAPITLHADGGAVLEIGSRVAINFGTALDAAGSVIVGDDVSFGPYCVVSDRDGSDSRPVSIGDGAWLASRVVVLPGSTIGEGATIAAGSIVDGEIAPRTLCSGIPARVIRSLDEPETVVVPAPPEPEFDTAGAVEPASGAAGSEAVPPVGRGVLISDFTIDPLQAALSRLTPSLDAEVAPFGAVGPSLIAPNGQRRDFAVVWTEAERTLPSLADVIEGAAVDPAAVEADVDSFVDLLSRGAEVFDVVIAPSWTLPTWERGLGAADLKPGGLGHAMSVANQRLIDRTSDLSNVVVLDARRWIEAVGAGAHSQRGWYRGKLPFDSRVFDLAAADVAAAVVATRSAPRKLIVVDLDNTLWGGVVGDDGPEGLVLGGHDGAGEAFVDFQRRLRALSRRGILLAIASKNEEEVALRAIEGLETMVLSMDDFVATRINWSDKAANIVSIAEELNLGLQSVVFIDDNPHERTRVREALPEVLVPDWPSDPMDYTSALASLTCFDALGATAEDRSRKEMYRTERAREAARSSFVSVDSWIEDLAIRVAANPLGPENLVRATQLLNKTNQMNLRTRRASEAELLGWAEAPGHETWCISVSDRLGDSGLTGVVSVATEGEHAELVDFVMSCRVMGRRIEAALLAVGARAAERQGARRLVAEPLPTAKNAPCVRFFAELDPEGGERHEFDVAELIEAPPGLTLALHDPVRTLTS